MDNTGAKELEKRGVADHCMMLPALGGESPEATDLTSMDMACPALKLSYMVLAKTQHGHLIFIMGDTHTYCYQPKVHAYTQF